MKKKSLIMMVAAVALVGVVGIGATLAYYTSATEQVTNTFTTGNVTAELKEYTSTDNTTEWDDSVDGKDVYPGQSITKRPVLTIKADSASCYGYLKVQGIDALVDAGFAVTYNMANTAVTPSTTAVLNTADWKKIESAEGKTYDGTYLYIGGTGGNQTGLAIPKGTSDRALPVLFDKVTYRTTSEGAASSSVVGGIQVIGCALQAEGFDSGVTAYEIIHATGQISDFTIH